MYREAKYLLENSTADEFEFTLSRKPTSQKPLVTGIYIALQNSRDH